MTWIEATREQRPWAGKNDYRTLAGCGVELLVGSLLEAL